MSFCFLLSNRELVMKSLLEVRQERSYRAFSDILRPLVHVGALLDGGAPLLFMIPATVRVPGLHAGANRYSDRLSVSVDAFL